MKKLLPILILSLFTFQCERGWLNEILNPTVLGCKDSTACNYNSDADEDDGSCLTNDCAGVCGGTAIIDSCNVCGGTVLVVDDCPQCDDGLELGCDGICSESPKTIDACGVCGGDGVCDGETNTYGCTTPSACNFDANAIIFDDSCWSATEGCECSDGEGSVADECGICGGSNDICYDMKFVNEIAANQEISIYQNSTQDDNLIYSEYCPDYCIVVEEDLLPEDNNYIVQFGGGIPVYFDVSTDVLITNTSDGLIITEWNP